jgi:hypothetical protein
MGGPRLGGERATLTEFLRGQRLTPEIKCSGLAAWREEIAFAGEFIADHDFDFVGQDGDGEPITLRELLVHMIEEYARHNGHADLIRERIDGRIGQ